jgi:putative ATPase
MDLFSSVDIRQLPGTPLAEKMRPVDLAEIIGQKKVLEQIQRYIKAQYLPNLILWGPPGTGKTTLAQLLSKVFDCEYISINAVQSGAKELREISESAKMRRVEQHRRTLLFVDEVHRFNKGQQDVLLPYIEKGDVTLIGATTENPSYELNKAILSRCRLIVFEKLTEDDLRQLAKRSLADKNFLDEESLQFLVNWSDGDARRMLIAVEEVTASVPDLSVPLSKDILKNLLGNIVIGHDKSSDSHYDLISAMIKSIRGSQADAGLYYLARLLKGGEDPLFIARRLVILASEDVGNADPRAIQVAVSCMQAVEFVGLPEGGINLAQAVCYLSSAPKSNRSYMGLKNAQAFVEAHGAQPVPLHLRSANTKEMKALGYGKDYLYPHDFPKAWVEQNYLPDDVKLDEPFYQPAEIGFEKQIKEYLQWLKK